MNTKQKKQMERVHRQFLKPEKPLPPAYWLETYRKGKNIYITARWGWSDGGNRGSRNLGNLEVVVPYLMENLHLLPKEARKSLIRIMSSHQPKLQQGLQEQINRLGRRETLANSNQIHIPRWEGGKQVQYIDWEMIDRAVFSE